MGGEELRQDDRAHKGTSGGSCDNNHENNGRLTLIPLIALIFYEVSGGPFGVEANHVAWISAAFGPFWGFQEGFWKSFSGVMDNALYPVLFLDYLKHSVPVFDMPIARIPFLLFITFCLTYLNYRGLAIVGFAAVGLTGFSLLPFLVMGVLSIPRLKPRRWLVMDASKVNWRGYFNSMFWNLNYWDKASTLVGEIENPIKTFPNALFGAVILVMLFYLIPLLAGTGALEITSSEWSDGYFAQVGMLIGGAWLRSWIQVAAALSNVGLFEAEMSSDAFQLLGMSEMGMLPEIFSYRSRYATPTFSILCSATGVVFLSWMSFQEIIEFLNFLYWVGMLLEFAAFIKLRIKRPDLHRPYKEDMSILVLPHLRRSRLSTAGRPISTTIVRLFSFCRMGFPVLHWSTSLAGCLCSFSCSNVAAAATIQLGPPLIQLSHRLIQLNHRLILSH